MPNINFYLKDLKATEPTPINLHFKYNKKRLVYGFGQKVHPKDWNRNKQRVKSNNQTTEDGKYSLNDLLDNLEQVCERAYHTEVKNGIPDPDTLRKYLAAFMNQNQKSNDGPTLAKLIERFINNEIRHQGKSKALNTLKTYQTLKGHLNDYEEHYKTTLDFESITLDFYYKYSSFLEEKVGLDVNSVGKDIQILKVIMGEAVDLGYTNNLQFRHKKFLVHREETDSVYLKESEVLALYRYDLSDNERLENIRDLFVLGSFTGLRFSDYSQIKPENIGQEEGHKYIKMRTQKTGELVIIPCNPIVEEILEKYSHSPNRLPQVPGNTPDTRNTLFNKYIKEACKVAGLTEKGRLVSAPEKELWECIGSHTARRSFATNLYLEGFPTIEIMKITGHKTEKSFMRYIKVSKLDAAKKLNQHYKDNWHKKLLRVA